MRPLFLKRGDRIRWSGKGIIPAQWVDFDPTVGINIQIEFFEYDSHSHSYTIRGFILDGDTSAQSKYIELKLPYPQKLERLKTGKTKRAKIVGKKGEFRPKREPAQPTPKSPKKERKSKKE